jgi:DNA-binding XRE family transcriptional regulator
MIDAETWLRKKLKDPKFKAEYDRLEPEFALAREVISARVKAKLSQAQVAKRMGTSQSAVARIESGRSPSLTSLRRYAKAVGSKLEIRLKKAG